jgi:hypothetical protein
MARNQVSQPQRTQNNPLNLGSFNHTTLRYLKGTLGPKNQVVGYADTNQQSNGGFGGGTYNHWFQVNLESPAWIIIKKGPPRPQYIQVSAYDINRNPIQGNPIFDEDSVTVTIDGQIYFPYADTVMSTQSDLYNQFSSLRLDKGDERYYPLNAGSYLICVSSTRNETLNYEVGIVIEFTVAEQLWATEDNFLCVQEYEIDVAEISSPITTDITFTQNVFVDTICQINAGVTVTIADGVTLLIASRIPLAALDDFGILLEPGDEEYFTTFHDHSLKEWTDAWNSSHQDTDKLPELFKTLVNLP